MLKITDLLTVFHCLSQILAENLWQDLYQNLAVFLTPFSRFWSQPSGNTGGQHDTLRLSSHDANWREHAESKSKNTDALATHVMIYQVLRCFLNLGPRALEMLQVPHYLNPALS